MVSMLFYNSGKPITDVNKHKLNVFCYRRNSFRKMLNQRVSPVPLLLMGHFIRLIVAPHTGDNNTSTPLKRTSNNAYKIQTDFFLQN